MNKNSEAMEDSQKPTRRSSSISTQHEGKDFLAASEKLGKTQQKNPSTKKKKKKKAPAPAPPPPDKNDALFFQGELRTGLWTQEEMDYLTALVDAFHAGSLPIPNGTTLRRYIASMLHCSAKRISKKMEGTDYHGRRPFLGKGEMSPEDIKALDTKLESLKVKFIQSVEELNLVQVAAVNKEEKKGDKNAKNKVDAKKSARVSRKRAPRYKSHAHKPELEQKQHPGMAEEVHNSNISNPYETEAAASSAAGVASALASEGAASAVAALPVVHSLLNPRTTVQRPLSTTNNQDLLFAAAAEPGGNTTLQSGYLEQLFSHERFQGLLHNSEGGGRNVATILQPLSTTTTATWSQGMQVLLETLAQVRAQQQAQETLQRQQQQPTIARMRHVEALAALPSSSSHLGLLASRPQPIHQPTTFSTALASASSSSSSRIFQRLAASLLAPSNQQQDAASIADFLHQRVAAPLPPPPAEEVITMQLRNVLSGSLFDATSSSRVRPSENSTTTSSGDGSGRLQEPEAKRPRFG